MSLKLVRQLQHKAIAVDRMCRVLAVSHIRTRSGWLYLAVVLDLFGRHAEATRDIADYIASFYNNVRLHSKLGNFPPNAFEQQSAIKQPISVCEIT